MLQIVLLIVVIFTAIALLIASHRAGHALFVRVSSAVVLVSLVLLVGLVVSLMRGWEQADKSNIDLTVLSAHPTESGYRLAANIQNRGEQAVAETRIRVRLEDCAEQPCRLVGEDSFTLSLHVPAGTDYPFGQVVRIAPANVHNPRWSLVVEQASAFR